MNAKIICLLIGFLSLSGVLTAQEIPPGIKFRIEDQLTANDRTILEAFIGHAVKYAEGLTAEKVAASCAKSPEGFAWVEFRYLDCLNTAYELTGDPAYLDRLSNSLKLFENILTKQDDNFLGWYGQTIDMRKAYTIDGKPIDELQCNFRGAGLIARWVELAKQNPAYAAQNKELIESRTRLLTEQLVPKWDARGFFAEIPGRGGVYRGLDYPSRWETTLSHEKLSIAVDGLLKLYRATGDDSFMKRALQIGAWFKSCLQVKDDHYEWMSWVPSGKWDVSPDKEDAWKTSWIAPDPNAEWYIAALSIALNFYQYGLLFNDEDLARFIQTQKTMCWNGDMEKPVYRSVSGQTGKWIKGRFLSCQIANYDPVLKQLAFYGPHEAEAMADINSSWKGGAMAQRYVYEKFIMQPVIEKNRQPDKALGEKFLQNKENQNFYNSLNFEVTAPGAVIPLKPSEMPELQQPVK